MKTTALILALLSILIVHLSAQSQPVIKEAAGKVEVQAPQQAWVPAKVGMKVSLGSLISTGFNSTAVLDLGGSVLQVKPLTRLRVNELIEKQGTVQTSLFLQVGKVKADVKTIAGVTQDFKVKGPVSTAAVRGTGFDYDGYDLYVYDGVVTFSNLLGQKRTYSSGEEGNTGGYDTPAEGEVGQENGAGVDPYAPGLGGQSSGGLPVKPNAGQTGGVIIIVPPPFLP
jgi:hypothetical protein